MIRISSAGVSGLCVGIFSSLQGWLCVWVLCALQCAKNSVGSGRQNHGCLNVYRTLFRVTYNIAPETFTSGTFTSCIPDKSNAAIVNFIILHYFIIIPKLIIPSSKHLKKYVPNLSASLFWPFFAWYPPPENDNQR